MNQKSLNIIYGIVIVVLIGAVVYFVFGKKSEPTNNSTNQTNSTNTPLTNNQQNTSTPTSTDPTVNWKTYSNQTFGFSIKYPQDWRTAQCGTNCVGFGPQNKPEDITISINILSQPMPEAKMYMPILGINNGITEEKSVTIGGIQWTRVTVQQNESGTKFYEYLKEISGKTVDIGGDGSAIFNQILSTFKFTEQLTATSEKPIIISPKNGEVIKDSNLVIKGKTKANYLVWVFANYSPADLNCLTRNSMASGGADKADSQGNFLITVPSGAYKQGQMSIVVAAFAENSVYAKQGTGGSDGCFPQGNLSDILSFTYSGN